jgi:hypothetical protein
VLRTCLSMFLLVSATGYALAKPSVNCAGAATAGGAQLICSQADPQAPTQSCTYSWALVTATNAIQIVEGSFLLPARASNVQIYQGAGFSSASSNPIVLCHSERSVH